MVAGACDKPGAQKSRTFNRTQLSLSNNNHPNENITETLKNVTLMEMRNTNIHEVRVHTSVFASWTYYSTKIHTNDRQYYNNPTYSTPLAALQPI